MILFLAGALLLSAPEVQKAFSGAEGAMVVKEVATGETFRSNASLAAEKLPPCSTFKIWNTAIGLETGAIEDVDALFWKWDGEKRSLAPWNQDQTVRSAFAVSCVPAYQALARKIGEKSMAEWIDRIGYGDRDLSSGLDVFWLPAPGRKSLLISADEQAALLARLAGDGFGFSPRVLAALADVMRVETTEKGTLYGKTGTGSLADGGLLGWFAGYVESGGKTFAFATVMKGEGASGKAARAATEKVFRERGWLAGESVD